MAIGRSHGWRAPAAPWKNLIKQCSQPIYSVQTVAQIVPLTLEELSAELQYRFSERIGNLCPNGETPTPEQRQIAQQELDAWLAEYRRLLAGAPILGAHR